MKTNRNDSVKGYQLDFSTNTLTVNYKFHKAMSDFGSPEYNRYKEIVTDFPNLTVVVKAGRTITTTRPTKRLTYANMDAYISCFKNSEELQNAFAIVKQRSKVLASPYKYVRDWFEAQFPDYRNAVNNNQDHDAVLVVAIPDLANYKKKDAINNEAVELVDTELKSA